MSDAEIEAAALSDPDAQPMTPEQLAATQPLPLAWRVRRKLRLSRAEFAARFRLPPDLLAAWERGNAVPDPGAANYLRLILADAAAVDRLLAADEPSGGAITATAAE